MASKQTEQLIPNLLLEELVISSPKPKQYTLEASMYYYCAYLQLSAAPPEQQT